MSPRPRPLVPALLAALALFAARPSAAAWPHDPAFNLLASSTTVYNSTPACVQDGAGGAIVAWADTRFGVREVFAQRISAAGVPLWTAGGVQVTSVSGAQKSEVTATADGSGGIVIAWTDGRNGPTDIYAQRLVASGAVAPGWPADGVQLSNLSAADGRPQIIADGTGGAIVAYVDFYGGADYDIYAQRVDGSGAIPAGWGPGFGAAVCIVVAIEDYPMLCSDGAGGAIIAWEDQRGADLDIYGARVTAAGALPWTSGGVVLGSAVGDQRLPRIAPDAAGGAIVAWQDRRSGTQWDTYAQRVTATGSIAIGWPASSSAAPVALAAEDDQPESLVPDGSGGALVAMTSYRSGQPDIYVQRLTGAGTIAFGWPAASAGGVAVCSVPGAQDFPPAVSDGAGGAIVAWRDARGGNDYDVSAQRITGAGSLGAGWTGGGVPVSIANGDQYPVVLCADGAGGAILAWTDNRAAPALGIYAQRIERYGQLGNPEPLITGVRDVANDQGGQVKLTWSPSYLDNDPQFAIASYWIWRSVPASVAAAALARGGRVHPLGSHEPPPPPGVRTFMATVTNGVTYDWEFVTSQVAQAFPGYSKVVATTSDSSAVANPYTVFLVEAKPPAGDAHWSSAPDSGYSVDNLPPAMPAPFSGQFSPTAGMSLQWGMNPEADLSGYRLHRGADAGFVPGPGNLVVALYGTSFLDAAGTEADYYRLAAIDTHGNLSPFALLNALNVVDTPLAQRPRELTLAVPGANPARSDPTVRFGLPRAAALSLAVFDAAGRRVRTLAAGPWDAGTHVVRWDGRNELGNRSASGVYLVRLEAEGHTLVRRILTLR